MGDDAGAPSPPEQRLRVTFATDDAVKYVGHLDMARTWERAIRRSGLPLAYSHGFNPQARIHFAAALPLGATGEAEVMDIYLIEAVTPHDALLRLQRATPGGIAPLQAEAVSMELPALQSRVQRARYRVEVETEEAEDGFRDRLRSFMGRSAAWRARRKGKDIVRYDLRPLVLEIAYIGATMIGQGFDTLMRHEPGATGRPDELLAELGYGEATRRITRTQLIFADESL